MQILSSRFKVSSRRFYESFISNKQYKSSVIRAIRDLQCDSWDVAFDCDLFSFYSGLELHKVGM